MKDSETDLTDLDAERQLDVPVIIIAFFEISEKYHQLTMSHLRMFLALLGVWAENRFRNPIIITRSKVMRLARINSKTTYHKCIKDFQIAGLIKYDPSFHPQGKSRIVFAC